MIKLTLKGGKFFLSFPFNHALITAMHRLPATWNKRTLVWELPATRATYEAIKSETGATLPELEDLRPKTVDLSLYEYKTKPFNHQAEAVEFMLRQFGFEVKK